MQKFLFPFEWHQQWSRFIKYALLTATWVAIARIYDTYDEPSLTRGEKIIEINTIKTFKMFFSKKMYI